MVHLLIIKLDSKEIDWVPVTGAPVGSRTVVGGGLPPLSLILKIGNFSRVLMPLPSLNLVFTFVRVIY